MTTGKTSQSPGLPRAIVHKRILEVAKARPDATIEEIAREVSGATVSLVERVLEEYGDPGEKSATAVPPETSTGSQANSNGSQPESNDVSGSHSGERDEERPKTQDEEGPEATAESRSDSRDGTRPEPKAEDLSETQYETLQLIYEHPTASQREIAAMLDIAHTTVYHRLQPIEGFSWVERWEYVTALFEAKDRERRTAVEDLAELNGHLTGSSDSDCCHFADPELAQKVIHAVIDADDITDDEVHLVVDELLQQAILEPE